MATVNIHEAKTHFSKLLARVHTGEEIIIAKAGRPYAKLVPLNPVCKNGLQELPAEPSPQHFSSLCA